MNYKILSLWVILVILVIIYLTRGNDDECDVDDDCPGGKVCDDNGMCVDDYECDVDDDCPGGQVCDDNGMCVDDYECDVDDDCPGGQICDDNGMCTLCQYYHKFFPSDSDKILVKDLQSDFSLSICMNDKNPDTIKLVGSMTYTTLQNPLPRPAIESYNDIWVQDMNSFTKDVPCSKNGISQSCQVIYDRNTGIAMLYIKIPDNMNGTLTFG